MKFLKILSVILSLLLLTACNSGQSVQTSETVSETETSAVTTTTAAKTTTKTETEAEPAKAAEEDEAEYVEVSPNNEFIDYEFIENYQGTTDIGDLADKAVDFLKTTEFYADSMKNISEFSDEEFSDYIKDGVIVPKFNIAYPNDYDGNGRTETFIMVDMPYKTSIMTVIRNFLIFADSGGHMEMLSDFSYFDTNSAQLLDYGKFKQIVIGAYGIVGADDHTILFGVTNGKAKKLYGGRISFYKSDCFVCTFGRQGSGDFMYFDIPADEYRAITGKSLTIDEIKEMDKDMTLKEYYDWYDENGYAVFVNIGGKYYNAALGPMDIGKFYTYENGKFILTNNVIRRSSNDYILKNVIDIDIDRAVAEMKSPAEPYVTVSPDNEFIDFEFIEDYKGTTDIGDLADKAVEFLKTTEEYADSMKNISEFSDEEFSDYIKDGVIVPKFNIAYPNDYDGDGRTETFIVVDMPAAWTNPHIWSFLLFADSSGNIEPTVIDFCQEYSAAMLNYGKNKQLVFGGWGDYQYYSGIYSVKSEKPITLYYNGIRGYFCKFDCFLSIFGLQGTSDFMYFDTAAEEYRIIKGVEISHDEMAELDVSNTLCSNFGEENIDELPDYVEFHFIKPNYYLLDWGFPGSDLFTYEDGVFTLIEDSNITRSSNHNKLDVVAEFDIDKAVAEMKKPEN